MYLLEVDIQEFKQKGDRNTRIAFSQKTQAIHRTYQLGKNPHALTLTCKVFHPFRSPQSYSSYKLKNL